MRHRPAFRAGEEITLDRAKDRGKTVILLQPLQVLHAVTASQVQENHGKHHLKVQPPLRAGDLDIAPDRGTETALLDHVQVDRKATQRGQPAVRAVGLILETKNALCHAAAPRW